MDPEARGRAFLRGGGLPRPPAEDRVPRFHRRLARRIVPQGRPRESTRPQGPRFGGGEEAPEVERMKILLTGATGFVGSRLKKRLEARGHSVRTVSRRPSADHDWSDASLERGVAETDAIVHLAGENLFDRRWSPARKALLRSSRVDTTRKLALLAARRKPSCFLSASAIGWYGTSETAVLDERSPRGSDFLADLCGEWEEATEAAV